MAKRNTVAVRFTGDVADLKRATGEAERELSGFGSRVGPKLKTAMLGVGVGAGAALTSAFFTHLDQEATAARLGASLGLSDAEAKRLGGTAGDLYTEGFGESFEEVGEAVAQVMSTLGEEGEDAIEPLTEKALNLAEVFGVDVANIIETVGFMIRNGLVEDATQGFDTITVALQKIPAAMREDALEALNEYSGSFAALGFDGAEALQLILTAGQETSVGVDKVGDAVKEFLIRATDGSAVTVEALETIGLNAEQIATNLASGGPAAEEAFGRVVAALQTVEDPAAQAQLSIALFGTPIEDLSVDKIPAFLAALGGAEEGLGDVEGAADDVGDSMDTNARKVEAFKRTMQQELVDFLAETAIPALEDFDENFGLTMRLIGFYAIDAIDNKVVPALGRLRDGFSGPIDGALDLLELLGEIGGHEALNAAADALGVERNEEAQDILDREAERRRTAPSNPTPVGTGGSTGSGGSTFQPRALGGDALAGRGYMVGERGVPEVFVPDVDGQIIPADRMGGGNIITINVQGAEHDPASIASHVAWALAGR